MTWAISWGNFSPLVITSTGDTWAGLGAQWRWMLPYGISQEIRIDKRKRESTSEPRFLAPFVVSPRWECSAIVIRGLEALLDSDGFTELLGGAVQSNELASPMNRTLLSIQNQHLWRTRLAAGAGRPPNLAALHEAPHPIFSPSASRDGRGATGRNTRPDTSEPMDKESSRLCVRYRGRRNYEGG